MSIKNIVESAHGALKGGANVQKSVREALVEGDKPMNEVLDDIAVAVSIFKEGSEDQLEHIGDLDVKKYRKQVNNIINDISRIVREATGRSIVLKSRKGGYVYTHEEAKVPRPRAPRTTLTGVGGPRRSASASAADTVAMDELRGQLTLVMGKLKALEDDFKNDPHAIIWRLLGNHGADKVGSVVVECLKDLKGVE